MPVFGKSFSELQIKSNIFYKDTCVAKADVSDRPQKMRWAALPRQHNLLWAGAVYAKAVHIYTEFENLHCAYQAKHQKSPAHRTHIPRRRRQRTAVQNVLENRACKVVHHVRVKLRHPHRHQQQQPPQVHAHGIRSNLLVAACSAADLCTICASAAPFAKMDLRFSIPQRLWQTVAGRSCCGPRRVRSAPTGADGACASCCGTARRRTVA